MKKLESDNTAFSYEPLFTGSLNKLNRSKYVPKTLDELVQEKKNQVDTADYIQMLLNPGQMSQPTQPFEQFIAEEVKQQEPYNIVNNTIGLPENKNVFPLRPEEPFVFGRDIPTPAPQPEAKSPVISKPKNIPQKSSVDNVNDIVTEKKEPYDPYIDVLKQSQDREFLAQIGEAAAKLGAGIAGMPGTKPVEADVAGFQKMQEQAYQPLKELSSRQEYQKKRQEAIRSNELKDPNSATSKSYKDMAKQIGLNIKPNMSAQDFEDMGLNFSSMYNMKMQNETNRALAEERKLDRQLASELKSEAKKSEDLNKYIDSTQKSVQSSKYLSNYIKAKDQLAAINSAVNNPTAIKDIGALYQIIKRFDEDSAVRGSELDLAKEASGFWGGMKAELSKYGAGNKVRLLPSHMLDQIKQYTQETLRQMDDGYNRRMQTYAKNIERKGGDPAQLMGLIDPYHNPVPKNTESEDIKKKLGFVPKK